jgi:hypothetical protein
MDQMTRNARLALETIRQRPTTGVPSWMLHVMEHAEIERLAGVHPGAYQREPEATYLAMQRRIGTCLVDQYIPLNPLEMGAGGYEGAVGMRVEDRVPHAVEQGTTPCADGGASCGAGQVVCDGIVIDSAEAVVEHLECVEFPRLLRMIFSFEEDKRVRGIVDDECAIQAELGPEILKSGYGFVTFPIMAYHVYGYAHYFEAYALFPEVMERHFELQADLAVLNNRAAARAYRGDRCVGDGSRDESEPPGDAAGPHGGAAAAYELPPLFRLDYDMADSRGTLVDIASLDRIWFPHFARAIEPLLGAACPHAGDVRLIWHCDGNLMEMVPRLIECGVRGFQGFQYESGMDYERICRMRSRDGEPLAIIAGVSVTRTLPSGTPDDVRDELRWLAENGPPVGLFLGASSSITPGVASRNLDALVEGLAYYRAHGRA